MSLEHQGLQPAPHRVIPQESSCSVGKFYQLPTPGGVPYRMTTWAPTLPAILCRTSSFLRPHCDKELLTCVTLLPCYDCYAVTTRKLDKKCTLIVLHHRLFLPYIVIGKHHFCATKF